MANKNEKKTDFNNPTRFVFGGKYYSILTIVTFPRELYPGFLANINSVKGVKLSIKHIPETLEELRNQITEEINDLKGILNNNSHDLSGILNWIYLNRKISFSSFARDEIIKIFSSVGYKIPKQTSYRIPELDVNLDYKNSQEMDTMRKNVVLNYLGILSIGNKLSSFEKGNLDTAVSTSNIVNSKKKPDIVFTAYDNEIDVSVTNQPEKDNKFEADASAELSDNSNSTLEINIENLLEDPMQTYSINTIVNDEKSNDIVEEFESSKENEADEVQEKAMTLD